MNQAIEARKSIKTFSVGMENYFRSKGVSEQEIEAMKTTGLTLAEFAQKKGELDDNQ